MEINPSIIAYNDKLASPDREIGNLLVSLIHQGLSEADSKIWHAHPVWFIDGNPIVGYSKQKDGMRLMFWSGADFGEERLTPGTGKFKDASIWYTAVDQIQTEELIRWLKKSSELQWDYKNIVKRKGKLLRLK